MKMPERHAKVLLTMREAARKLGVPDDLLTELVFVHPPILDVMLVGRSPRVYAYQLAALRKRWVALAMELIEKNPPLLAIALAGNKPQAMHAPGSHPLASSMAAPQGFDGGVNFQEVRGMIGKVSVGIRDR